MYTFYIKNYYDSQGAEQAQEKEIYSVPLTDPENLLQFIDPSVKGEMGKAGTLEFTIQPCHPFYNAWKQMVTILRVEYDGDTIFRGRVITVDEPNMYGEKKIHCEGDLAFFLDSQQAGVKDDNRSEVTPYAYLTSVINEHNRQMANDPDKLFTIGEVPGHYSAAISDGQKVKEESYKYGSGSWQSTMSALESLQKECGGFFRTRYQNGTCYLDWLDNFYSAAVNTQPISIGKNLLDISKSSEVENVFTVLIPIGSKDNEDLYLPGRYFRVEDIVQYYTDEELNYGYHSKRDYENAYNDYGTIYKPEQFRNADTEAKLRAYASDYIRRNYVGGINSFTIGALDMHHIDGHVQKHLVGDQIPIEYTTGAGPSGDQAVIVRKVLTATSITYCPHEPDKNEYSIGIPESTISKEYGSSNKNKSRLSSSSSGLDYEIPDLEIPDIQSEVDELLNNDARLQNYDDLAWRFVIDNAHNVPEYQRLLTEDPQIDEHTGILRTTKMLIQSDMESPNNFRYNRIVFGGKTSDILINMDLSGLDMQDEETVKNVVAKIPKIQEAIRALVIDCYENQLSMNEKISRNSTGTIRWFKDIELALNNPEANPEAINDVRALNDGTITFEEFLHRHPIEGETEPKTTFKLNGNTGTVFNFTSVLGGATNADGLFSPITLDGRTGTVSIGSSLESLLGSDGTVTAQSLISAVPGLSGQIDASGNITSIGKAMLEKKFPGISKLISGVTTVAKIGDVVSKVKSGAAQLVGNLVPLSGLGNTANEIKKNLTNLIPGLNSEIDANGNITAAGQELISGKVAELGGENTTFSSLLDILGLKKSQPGATVALDGATGTQKIGKDDNGDWNITMNEPITYTDSSGVTHTLTGAVRAKDFSLQEVPSFKTKFASIDTLLANAIYTNTLDAAVARAGYLKTENLDAAVAHAGYLKTENLEAEAATIGLLNASELEAAIASISELRTEAIDSSSSIHSDISMDTTTMDAGFGYFTNLYVGSNRMQLMPGETPSNGANVANAVASFGTVTSSGGQISIPYTRLSGGTGSINFNIADTQYFQDSVSAAVRQAKQIETMGTVVINTSDFGQTVSRSLSVSNAYDGESTFLEFDVRVAAAAQSTLYYWANGQRYNPPTGNTVLRIPDGTDYMVGTGTNNRFWVGARPTLLFRQIVESNGTPVTQMAAFVADINGADYPGKVIRVAKADDPENISSYVSISIPAAAAQRTVSSLADVTLTGTEIGTTSHPVDITYSDGTTGMAPINIGAYNVYTAGKNYIMENWSLSLGRYLNGSSSLSYTALSNDGNNAIELDYGEYAFAAIMLDGTARKFGAIKAPDQPRHTYYDTRQMYYISERTGQYVAAGNANTVWYYETGTA